MNAAQPAEMSKAQLEVRVKERLEAMAGRKADSLVCNGNIRAEVGATQRCVLTVGATKLGVTVTVTNVDGTDLKLDAEVDDKPMA
ncbi:DUF4333 domain-containing protein [Mycobacterium hubeiense]|uniref:DUF4333 domain-containing protein n=1 Tax=Mycobacterium hubeiense TaxID=1867256 RepID=UPI000C7EC59C|nr:DUF4333 domain-containing protein [Mycobacterium sp. QGD 101]